MKHLDKEPLAKLNLVFIP